MSFSVSEIIFSAICAFSYGILFAVLTFLLSVFRYTRFLCFLEVIVFGIGFMLISYFSLDGMIRIYMLALSFGGFFLVKKYICDKILICMHKMTKKIIKFPKINIAKAEDTLDKIEEKC